MDLLALARLEGASGWVIDTSVSRTRVITFALFGGFFPRPNACHAVVSLDGVYYEIMSISDFTTTMCQAGQCMP